jgi:cell division septal protein FtsQ
MNLRRQPPRPRPPGRSGGTSRGLPPARSSPRRGARDRRLNLLRLPLPRLPLPHLPGRPHLPALPAWLRRPDRGATAAAPHRARSLFTPTRAAALLALLVSGGALYGAGASDAFGFDRLELAGLTWTDEAALRDLIGVSPGENLFAVRTAPIAERIEALAPVAAVRVEVRLPDTLLVRVTEREAVLVWRLSDGRRFLVDRDGVAFVALAEADSTPAGMPIIRDDRAGVAAELSVGRAVPAVDLDAAARLASVTPADLESVATSLMVSISDANGFVVRSRPPGWIAIFGFYTPNLRTTELIPGQVRLLKSLLSGREAEVGQVILADDVNGTYVPRASPAASP